MGISVDWTRQYFTLDLSAPQIAFVRLAEEGRIYRRARPINWCGYLKTAISDIEVERVEIAGSSLLALPGREKKVQVGLLHRIAYAVVDQPGEEILVDTTRIETLPGDEAIAVNPNDERYKKWHGAMLQHPLLPFKRIPVIVDDWVDPEFGTGACKVTPAHDFDDFNLGLRHSLPLDRTIWDEAGRFINNCGIPLLQGKDRFEARPQIVELLKDAYRGHQSHQMVLALCARSGDLLEPRIMPQWYLKMSDLAQAALGLVEQGKLKLVGGGGGYEQEWERWMSNVQDWCISRQLWWGHQIPAWRTEKGDWVFATNQQEALEKAQYLYGSCGQVEQVSWLNVSVYE